MLTRELMAYVGLWILWGNTLLIALATSKRAWAWLSRAKAWQRGGAVRGEVVAGEEGLAAFVVHQNGRLAAEKRRAILWHDRSYETRLVPGRGPSAPPGHVQIEGQRVTLSPDTAAWVGPAELEAAARCHSPEDFERAYADARRVKGFARTVVAPIHSGRKVWLIGALQPAEGSGNDARTLVPDARGDCAVSTVDPIRLARGHAYLALFGFLPGMFALAGVCTMLAMTEPVFDGWVSKLGGLASVVYFLLVLPAGTMLRDAVRDPDARALRGRWLDPSASRQTMAEAV